VAFEEGVAIRGNDGRGVVWLSHNSGLTSLQMATMRRSKSHAAWCEAPSKSNDIF
jgi:hypothetical protein